MTAFDQRPAADFDKDGVGHDSTGPAVVIRDIVRQSTCRRSP
jgi:hypothetical protein